MNIYICIDGIIFSTYLNFLFPPIEIVYTPTLSLHLDIPKSFYFSAYLIYRYILCFQSLFIFLQVFIIIILNNTTEYLK